jgi:2'-5' RNA ligase
MRLFIALDIDNSIAQKLDDYVRTLAPRFPGVRFVRSGNYHVTLKFLGEVREVDAARAALREVRESAVELHVGGVGFFPNARAPRVFWAGIEAPDLPSLASQIEERMAVLGYPRERDFHPHLTLARNGSGRPRPVRGERSSEAFAQLATYVASSPKPEFGTMTGCEFFLYESKLLAGGAEYRKIERYSLGG